MVGEVSEDGKWVWDGSNWQPVQTEVIPTLPPTPTTNTNTLCINAHRLTAYVFHALLVYVLLILKTVTAMLLCVCVLYVYLGSP